MLLVARDASPEALVADWTLPHELSHLWHPFVERRSAWLSEGLATYYQEVARARAGAIPAARAWRRLYEGAALGRDASTTLAEASERVFQTYDFPRVYWGGAAIALLADVELRRRSGGTRSLDDVVAELSRCCAGDPRAWRAEDLIDRMDAIAGTPVFSALVSRHVTGTEHADLAATFARLGLRRRGEDFELVDDAPAAWIRDAIMAGEPPTGAVTAAAP